MYNAIQNKVHTIQTRPLANFLTISIQLYKSESPVMTTISNKIYNQYNQTFKALK